MIKRSLSEEKELYEILRRLTAGDKKEAYVKALLAIAEEFKEAEKETAMEDIYEITQRFNATTYCNVIPRLAAEIMEEGGDKK